MYNLLVCSLSHGLWGVLRWWRFSRLWLYWGWPRVPLFRGFGWCVVLCVCEGDVLFVRDCPSSCIVRWSAEEGRREEG